MEIKPVILVLADISGYTQFIKWHRRSLLHAEKIIVELLESVIKEADEPLVVHELEGDAVMFYAIDENGTGGASRVFSQAEHFVKAFRAREAELVSECSVCSCEACQRVGQLKLKIVIHRGEAAITELGRFTKVAGEDTIIAHRLLKNSVPSDEYILMTDAFVRSCPDAHERALEHHTEYPEGLDAVQVHILDFESGEAVTWPTRSFWGKLKTIVLLEGHEIRRRLGGRRRTFRHLPDTSETRAATSGR